MCVQVCVCEGVCVSVCLCVVCVGVWRVCMCMHVMLLFVCVCSAHNHSLTLLSGAEIGQVTLCVIDTTHPLSLLIIRNRVHDLSSLRFASNPHSLCLSACYLSVRGWGVRACMCVCLVGVVCVCVLCVCVLCVTYAVLATQHESQQSDHSAQRVCEGD